MKQLFPLLLFWTLSNCNTDSESQDKNELKSNLTGHWHTTIQSSGPNHHYHTLDIEDSSQIDKHKLTGLKHYKFPLEYKGNLILPTIDRSSDSLKFIGDTLLVFGEGEIYAYLRSDLNECLQEDLFSNLLLDINLPLRGANSISKEELGPLRLIYISAGQLKPNLAHYFDGNYFQKDSCFVETNQILIGEPSMITKFVYRELNRNVPTAICLNFDMDAPPDMVGIIIDKVKEAGAENVFLTSFNEEKNEVSYEELK